MRDDLIPITLLKEFVYCPRLAYYKYFNFVEPATESMRYAKQVRPSAIEISKTISTFVKDSCELELERYVESPRLGLRGYVDALAICDKEAIPVEVKLSSSPEALKRYSLHHIVQLVAYAIAVEETIRKPVYRAIVVSLEPPTAFQIVLSPALREHVYRVARELHRMIEQESFPRPTAKKRKCSACFYKKMCPG
ncbi:MAG: CRISPR-associated protein Cas4 [Ignisphaera sp.]